MTVIMRTLALRCSFLVFAKFTTRLYYSIEAAAHPDLPGPLHGHVQLHVQQSLSWIDTPETADVCT